MKFLFDPTQLRLGGSSSTQKRGLSFGGASHGKWVNFHPLRPLGHPASSVASSPHLMDGRADLNVAHGLGTLSFHHPIMVSRGCPVV